MKLFGILAVGVALALGACTEADVKKVQDITRTTCKFVPTAETVVNIFLSGGYASSFSIAKAICAAVVVNPMAEGPGGRRAPSVNGVSVRGKFVK